jgi:hypothetical protein
MSPNEIVAQKLPVSGSRLLAAFSILVALIAALWLAVPHLPEAVTCPFRDNAMLRWLWPGNESMYDDLILWHGSVSDACTLFATRSNWSVVLAIYSTLFYFTLLFKAKIAKPGPGVATFAVAFMIVGMFAGGFNDHATGRGAWGAYRTMDSTNTLLWKSLIREFLLLHSYLGSASKVCLAPENPTLEHGAIASKLIGTIAGCGLLRSEISELLLISGTLLGPHEPSASAGCGLQPDPRSRRRASRSALARTSV